MTDSEAAAFHFHRIRREISNFSLLKHRKVDGHLVSQHQSGTHWLKYMLANAIARHYEIPAPQYNHANDIIGGPKDPVVYDNIPRLISSHGIPPFGFGFVVKRGLISAPKYIVLVRDIRDSLVSNFRKWEQRYAVNFETYLRGDPAGRQYNSDLWWCIRFQNAWGKIAATMPGRVLTTRYETLRENPAREIERLANFWGLPLNHDDIETAVAAASKEQMLERADPDRPPGEVQVGGPAREQWFDSTSRRYFAERCARYLHFNFGYDYAQWQ